MKKEGIDHISADGYLANVNVPTENSRLLAILREEQLKAGLEKASISICIPEDPSDADRSDPNLLEDAAGSKESGYSISLYPSVLRREGISFRSKIRHGLAHIKYGDCDRRLPPLLKNIHSFFIAEPRARRYERSG